MKRRHRQAHRLIWLLLSVLLPAAVLLPLAFRTGGPLEAPAIRLEAPK